ncbi:54S ribosomal protein L32, mitochondrial [Nakaseomyces glabratus]|uniref:Large ribosomal subunit protein bL32m n=1 Tax=Candida glabrata TaxID=5478 RepID=A0A0W0D5L1_CANGB|nr:Ribosomal L32p protein family [Nakaseomyces glabratus]KAH7602407.1 Ribosomal L32p protein family [Nakaseomyces glabratus]KAH7613797.1 Ribosomal L32p protein family [Nakaseomyces glabratus]KAI8386649.1 Ribosomal L32p protein family [Nakaseomyces glabratus]KAI8397836.1 Ribosomal L32p protein family [Nakaseomyces glabratus]
MSMLARLSSGYIFAGAGVGSQAVVTPATLGLAGVSQAIPALLGKLLGDTEAKEETGFFDNGILLAAPKKKVSHQKKRQRLLAPGKKHVNMMNHLNRCPSCGHYKRANTICMHCFENVRFLWKSYTQEQRQEPIQEQNLTDLDKRVLYPGKMDTVYEEKLKDKDSYLVRRMRTLPKEDPKVES